jgi:hypothetical protein
MSHYYYDQRTKSFTDSSGKLQGPYLVELTEAEYHLTRLLVRDYDLDDINRALNSLARKMDVPKEYVEILR